MMRLSRRATIGTALAAPFIRRAAADEKTLVIAVDLPLTGAQADTATLVRYGVQSAVDGINEKGGIAGYKLSLLTLDDGTATAGQYDPAQAATNARKMVSDPSWRRSGR